MNYVLVVDDSAEDRDAASALLEKHGHLYIEFATNGIEAIEHLENSTPLAIITGLEMPEMDGLALVKQVRSRFPTIPIILIIAQGNEEAAVEALVAGATDFVPKHRLAQDLIPSLESILSISATDPRHEPTTRFLRYNQLRYEVDGEMTLIPALVDQMQRATANFSVVSGSDRIRLAKCLLEALRNAVQHGCHGAPPASSTCHCPTVFVQVEITPEEARYTIRDQGPGFDSSMVVDPRENPASISENSGRGFAIMQCFLDEVRFNATGNEVTLVKKRAVASPD